MTQTTTKDKVVYSDSFGYKPSSDFANSHDDVYSLQFESDTQIFTLVLFEHTI
jgi:hypothetical protein